MERSSGYGSVPGLEDEELASPAELEWQVFVADWGPILDLPWKGSDSGIRPVVDEFGQLDWGAFGTVDFARLRPPFDKARYKADRLQEQLRNDLITLDIVRERLAPEVRGQVRSAVLHGGADLDDFSDPDQWAYAKWLLRIRRLASEIQELRLFSRQRRLSMAASAQ